MDDRDHVPLRGYVIGPLWTVDTVHHADVSESTARMAHRANQRLPHGARLAATGQPAFSYVPFALRSLQFLEINPRSMPAQNNLFLVLFSFVLALVALSISTRSPVSI